MKPGIFRSFYIFLWGIALSLLAITASPAEDFTFQAAGFCLRIAPNSTVTQFSAADGESWLEKSLSLASVTLAGKTIPSTEFSRSENSLWHLRFGESEIQADIRISSAKEGLLFEVVRITGGEFDTLTLASLKTNVKERIGWMFGVASDNRIVVSFLGLSDDVESRAIGGGIVEARVHREFGFEGRKALLVVAPPKQFRETVRRVEEEYGLPSPKIDGEWAKSSAAVRTSYLFTDLTEANVDETIRYAQMGGFRYILTYSSTWSSSLGSYPIHPKNFPNGEAGLKAVVDQCHAAGLKVGIHMLTSFVGKNDPLVRPVPDSRLLKNGEATLANAVDAKATELIATAPLTSFSTEAAIHGSPNAGLDIQIDDEIIRYRQIGGDDGKSLLQCVRGFSGTKAAPHAAGAKIYHLAEHYGSYLVDLRTSLKGEVSERIAGLINRCGLDMIYFDGGEVNGANGPFWYWVSQQQADICSRVKRPILAQGSGMTPWLWHWLTRGACDDFAAVAVKEFLDYHKIGDSWKGYHNSFFPPELGWWGFLADTPYQTATTPDEVAYYATRMIALETPVSMETSLSKLQANGRTEEMLRLLNAYETLRLSGTVPEKIREALQIGEWRLIPPTKPGEAPRFVPIRYEMHRIGTTSEVWMKNNFAAQPLRVRLRCIPTLDALDSQKNLALFRPEKPLELSLPDEKAKMPGARVERIEFAHAEGDQASPLLVGADSAPNGGVIGKTLDLTTHRAIAVRLVVEKDTPSDVVEVLPAVLNVQLETPGKVFRDYAMDLDFTGEKTILLPEPTTRRTLPEFRPNGANYSFKLAMYHFDYAQVSALNLRWMRAPKSGLRCRVLEISAINELPTPLTNPTLQIGAEKITFPLTLHPGHYLEFLAPDSARVFDANGMSLSKLNFKSPPPTVPSGSVAISLQSDTEGTAELTLITEEK